MIQKTFASLALIGTICGFVFFASSDAMGEGTFLQTTPTALDVAWDAWALANAANGRNYSDPKVLALRKGLFKKNWEFFSKWNSTKEGYNLALN